MKINNILENMTPSSSTANQGGGQAPVMGRSDKFLETTSAVISPGGETTSKIQRRGKEGSNLLRGIKTSKKFVNSPMAESTVSEADISEEHLGAKERRKELFNKSKDRQLGNRPDSKDILPKDMEGEGDTLKNSLHTIIRVATHLDKALSVHDEFPEWISEKIGATKSMMVNIMNYVISNQEMQDDGEEINELSSEKLGQYKKAAGAQASELDKAAWAGAPDAKSKINKANKRFDGIVKATKKQFANDIKKHYDGKTQGVAEATGDKPFDNMMKTIKKGTQKQATADRREQKAKNKEQAAAAFGNMFGGGNPADKLKIKEQDVAEGVGETPQQQKVRAAISSGLAKSSQMGKAEYQSQPTNRHYFDNAGYASDKLTGIDSIDPDGTVVISIGDTGATNWVKKLAALGGMPGVKTREVQPKLAQGVAEAIDSPSLNRYRDAIFSASIPQKKEMIKNLIDAVLINEPTMYKSYVFNLRGSNDPKFLNQMTDELAGYYLHKNQQGVAEGSGGNWYIRVNGKILNDTKFKPVIFSSEDEARSHAMKLADKKRIPLSQIKLTKSWMDAPEQGVAEGLSEEINRRGFLKGLGAAAVAGATGSAMAQSQPVDASRAFANMRKDDPLVQHNKDIDEMARAIYDQIITQRGQPMDRRQQQMWMTIAREKASEKLAKYAPGRPATQPQSSGFPSQGSERRVSRNIDNFESVEQGVAEESKGLWANIHAKQKRIKSGSGEHMRKPGSKGAPTAKSFKDSATKSVKETGAPAPTRMNPPREYDRRRGD